ncbi:hypothetical protein MMC07_006080 [Pseudocyphellaria aurata]|nr:hypothetical protein [Pseudocyphellaria aurata]
MLFYFMFTALRIMQALGIAVMIKGAGQSVAVCVDDFFKFAWRHNLAESDRAGFDDSLGVDARAAGKAIYQLVGADVLAHATFWPMERKTEPPSCCMKNIKVLPRGTSAHGRTLWAPVGRSESRSQCQSGMTLNRASWIGTGIRPTMGAAGEGPSTLGSLIK